jgi:hypothetical protein
MKARILKKSVQYGEGILINWLSGLSFLGVLWFAQRFWSLRLIPFNVLDALLLDGVVILILLALVVLILYLALRHYLIKYPYIAIALGIGLLATAFAASTFTEERMKELGIWVAKQQKTEQVEDGPITQAQSRTSGKG